MQAKRVMWVDTISDLFKCGSSISDLQLTRMCSVQSLADQIRTENKSDKQAGTDFSTPKCILKGFDDDDDDNNKSKLKITVFSLLTLRVAFHTNKSRTHPRLITYEPINPPLINGNPLLVSCNHLIGHNN